MSEYINRDDVLDCFHDWIDKHGDAHEPDEMEEYRDIEALPSIELVRCRVCKYWEGEERHGFYYFEHCSLSDMDTNSDDFCSNGERGDSE